MTTITRGNKFIDLSVDINDIEDTFRDMNTALRKATVNALNTVGRAANKTIATDIKKNYNIKARTLKIGKTVKLKRADARKHRAVFVISILKKTRGLALYSPLKGKKGVSVKVKRTRKTVRGSFFVKSKRHNKTFVARKDKKGGWIERVSTTGKRYKAAKSEWLVGPSIAQLYSRRKVRRILDEIINDKYEAEVAKQFNNQFERKRR